MTSIDSWSNYGCVKIRHRDVTASLEHQNERAPTAYTLECQIRTILIFIIYVFCRVLFPWFCVCFSSFESNFSGIIFQAINPVIDSSLHVESKQFVFKNNLLLNMSKDTHIDRDLDLSNANRGVWLVKVPKYVANRWEKASSDMEVGKLKIAK